VGFGFKEVAGLPHAVIHGHSLFYQIAGPQAGSRLPVILVHGLGSCGEDWQLQLDQVADDRRALLPDLWGHGQSSRADRRFRIADLAADVAELSDSLGIAQAHWVGLSLGALVGLQAALDYPEKVRSLTLVNGFARIRLHGASAVSGVGRVGLLAIGRMDWLGRWVAQALFPLEAQAELRRRAAERICGNERSSYVRTLLAVARFDVRPGLAGIGVPSLVVAGGRDRIVPMSAKAILARGLPHARLEVLPESGHATPIDSPEAFNRLLMEFLDEVERPRPVSL
jgi:3-oxoadipate enol-lactonase